jgi:hypothetical protein
LRRQIGRRSSSAPRRSANQPIFAAIASGAPGGTRNPVRPSSIKSSPPALRVTISGSPQASASC